MSESRLSLLSRHLGNPSSTTALQPSRSTDAGLSTETQDTPGTETAFNMTTEFQDNKCPSSRPPHAPLHRQYGEQGQNTQPLVDATFHTTILAPDGFTTVEPGSMYRPDEAQPGRREPSFPNLHNLHADVIQRTLTPPSDFPSNCLEIPRRAMI
jgi:hypothetical protein